VSDTSTLSNDQITVTVSDTTLEAEVRHLPSGAAWAFRRAHGAELRVNHGQHTSTAHLSDAREIRAFRYTSLREQRLTYHVTGLPGDVALSVTYTLPQDEPVLRMEIAPLPTSSASRVTDVWFPGQLVPQGHELEATLWPNMSGTLIPAEYGQDIGMPEGDSTPRALANHHALHPASDRSLYQPWWGLLAQGGACVAIAETDLDFALDLWHPAGGPTHASPAWLPSLGELAYPRAIRYQFLGPSTHASLAKVYRRWAQHTGRWVSLQEKIQRNPIVEQLVGTTIFAATVCSLKRDTFPPQMYVAPFAKLTKQLDTLRDLGISRAYLHVDGWGFHGYDAHHPDVLPPCPQAGGWEGLIAFAQKAQELGYLFGLHDQYHDYYLNGPAYQDRRTLKGPDGESPTYDVWAGGAQNFLCGREALPYVRRTFEELLGRGVPLTASYLDVFAAIVLDECYDPAHPMTRTDCLRWRAQALEYVRSLGLAVSSEEPVDQFVPHLDFCHWADAPRWQFMSGPPIGIPVPLHNLVYHDALLTPAVYDAGYDGSLRNEYALRGLAEAEIPYGRLGRDQPSQFAHTRLMAALHADWGTHELVDHQLLEANGSIQSFVYPNGSVQIDLARQRYRICGGRLQTDGWVALEKETP
jgi:hypothetical protein